MEHTLVFLLPLAGILIGAKIAGQLSHRIGLPAVFGELMLGLILGPAVFGLMQSNDTLQLLSNIGVLILMFIAGLETDVAGMRQAGKASLWTAIGGVLMPLGFGAVAGHMFGLTWPQAIFLGTVLTATSVSISAQTLRELGVLRTAEGSTILGAAIIDDVLGVLVFAVVMSLMGEGSLYWTLIKMTVFFPVAWFVGDALVPWIVRWEQRMHHREASLAVILGLLLVYAWSAEVLGSVATITGAYILGVVVARHAKEGHIVHEGIAAIGYAFFIPMFFVNIGLQAHAEGLYAVPWITLAMIVVAVVTKIVGGGVGAMLGGFGRRSALQIGVGMVSRGEVALVIASAGLTSGLLSSEVFSVLLIVTIATTLLTPPLLRWVFPAPAAVEPTTVPVVAFGDVLVTE